MNTIPDRQTLSSLRRADLQKLCKERGLRANMRSGELIDLLLDIAHGEEIRRPPSRASSMRVVSRAGSTSSIRSRAGSIIVHDLIEEPAHDGQPVSEPMLSDTGIETTNSAQAGPSTRRKAKETQFKLGVGRPAVIGGTGARAPSSSTSKPRSTRGRTAVIAQPSEVAIQEEDEEPATSTDPLKGSSTTPMELDSRTQSVLSVAPVAVSSSSEEFRAYVATVLEPLKAQIGALQADLERAKRDAEDVHSLRSSISELTSQLAALQGRDQDKTRLLESLREELAALKLAHVSEDAYLSSDNIASESHLPGMEESDQTNPSHPTKSSLGKRRRGMNDSVLASAGIVSSSQADTTSGHATTARVSHPSRKKAKLDPPQDQVTEESQIGTEDVEFSEENNVENSERAPRPFTIFSGPEERSELHAFADGPPSTVRLSEMFAFPAVTPPNGTTPSVPTSTAHGPENRGPSTGNAFSFNFATSIFRPMTSTPTVRPIAALPPPEPPTSPSPAGPGVSALSYPPGSRSRPGSRPTSRAAQTQVQLGVTAPAAPIAGPSTAQVVSDGPPASTSVIQTPSLAAVVEETSSNAEGAMYANPMRVGSLGVGLPGIVPLPMPPDTPDQPMKRTMYGTELEGDSRFGDFGVEGVAMGFWTGAAPRF